MSKSPPCSTRVFLVRHGEVEAHWRGRLYGCHDVPLSEHGRLEAGRVGRQLEAIALAAVVSSGLERAEFGAACLRRGRALAREDDPELREIERGAWVGLAPGEVPSRLWQRWVADPQRERPPGGENLADLSARVLPRIRFYAGRHRGAAIAIVAHAWVVRVCVAHALGLALEHAPELRIRTGAVAVLDWPASLEEDSVGGPMGENQRPVLAALDPDRLPSEAADWSRSPRRGEPRCS